MSPSPPPAAHGETRRRVCVVHLVPDDVTETFAHAHAERLPCDVSLVHGDKRRPLYVDGRPIFSRRLGPRSLRRAQRAARSWRGIDAEAATNLAIYTRAFSRARCDAVLAEFGHVGVDAMDACRHLELPLIVHFHGFDAYARRVLDRYGSRYPQLFQQAAAVIAVSAPMRDALLALGAADEKTYTVPYGVDTTRFLGAVPDRAEPVVLAVGRFVEKKAPQLTIEAFASASQQHPSARLRMIGDGELLPACRELTERLGIEEKVAFLGPQPHDRVAEEMQRARVFAQHSIVARDGDSEGTPVAIIEASATGLPVVSTRHAGIPDVVIDGKTGFLVDEHDVVAMARHLERLVVDPVLAMHLGRAGRRQIEDRFTIESSIASLWAIILQAITSHEAQGR